MPERNFIKMILWFIFAILMCLLAWGCPSKPTEQKSDITLSPDAINGSIVRVFTVTDEDSGTVIDWKISGGNIGGAFRLKPISPLKCNLLINDSRVFKGTKYFTLRVVATDNGIPGNRTLTFSTSNTLTIKISK